jgi:hypothetical protein
MDYVGIDVLKNQRQIGCFTKADEVLPQCIRPERECCAAVCAERPNPGAWAPSSASQVRGPRLPRGRQRLSGGGAGGEKGLWNSYPQSSLAAAQRAQTPVSARVDWRRRRYEVELQRRVLRSRPAAFVPPRECSPGHAAAFPAGYVIAVVLHMSLFRVRFTTFPRW